MCIRDRAQTLPATLETTTQPNAAIDVAEGQTVALEFGSRLQTTPTAPPDTPTADATQLTATAVDAVVTGGEAADAGGSNWLVYLGVGCLLYTSPVYSTARAASRRRWPCAYRRR